MTYVLKNSKNELYYATPELYVSNLIFAKRFSSEQQAVKYIKLEKVIDDADIYEISDEATISFKREWLLHCIRGCPDLRGLHDEKI